MEELKGDSNRRIAKNTLFLYFRMALTVMLGLYTSRVVLQVLGASDYGLYNVTAGILAMFMSVRGALMVGTQRFLNVAMGERDDIKLKSVFSISMGMHLIISVVILILGETIGLWFAYNYLNIPDGRFSAAMWVYQLALLGFIINMIQLPFQACIIAHEDMSIYAYVSIYEVLLNLGIIYIVKFIDFDKLILYAILIFVLHATVALIYNYYCRKHYKECSFKIDTNRKLALNIVSFSGWNLLGGSMSPITNQGINILLNIFCGTIVNAARGLSISVSSYLVSFVTNFQMAANPQIVKLFAEKQWEKLYTLIINSARISAYLFLIIAIPVFIEIKYILQIWLGDYPPYTDVFIQIVLLQAFVQAVNRPINMSVQASGRVKWLNVLDSLFLLILMPLSYMLLKEGFSPTSVYWVNVMFFIVDMFLCQYFAHKHIKLPIKLLYREVYTNSIIGGVSIFIPSYIVSITIYNPLIRFVTVLGVSFLTSVIVLYFWGLTPGMKSMINDRIKKLTEK